MFANSQQCFEQQPSVIVRQDGRQSQDGGADYQQPPNQPAQFGHNYIAANTPITPGYHNYPMIFPFQFSEWGGLFPQPSPADSNCSGQLGGQNLQSPILNSNAIGGSLNPLQPRFPGYAPRPYDFSSSVGPFMGSGKAHKGGRRPRDLDNMFDDDCNDPEEMEKRQKRRQRNKEAAARCRQRRLDLMGSLQEQVDRHKADNDRKEQEIRSIRKQMERMIDFMRSHDCKMSDEDRANLNSILSNNSHPFGNSNMVNGNAQQYNKVSHQSLPSNDYAPARQAVKRAAPPVSQMPPTSDMSILEPDMKVQKIKDDPTLAAVNGGDDTITRPDTLNIGGLGGGNNSIPLTTPSNFQFGNTPINTYNTGGQLFGSLFSATGEQQNVFLNGSTGLTPSGAPSMTFVTTSTPLQTDEQNLRHL